MALRLLSRMWKRAGRSISTSRNISIATVNHLVGRRSLILYKYRYSLSKKLAYVYFQGIAYNR